MTTLLMFATALAVLLFLITLLVYLFKIAHLLEAIGGSSTSLLAKLRLGLRAIETETGHLGGLLQPINRDLTAVDQGLSQVDAHLKNTVSAAAAQGEGS